MSGSLGITFPPVPGGIYGTGESQDINNGIPQPANFMGMTGWFNPPTNWYCKWVDGQPFVSPTWNFSKWIFACKINYDGAFVFQCRGLSLFGIQQLEVTYPPVDIFAQAIFFKGYIPNIVPIDQALPAIAYSEVGNVYGWSIALSYWIPIITGDGNPFTPPYNSQVEAGSDQIMFFATGQAVSPNDKTIAALAYDAHNNLYGWDTQNGFYIPLISTDGEILIPSISVANPEGQIAYGDSDTPVTPVDQTEPQLYYSLSGKLSGWNTSSLSQIPLIS